MSKLQKETNDLKTWCEQNGRMDLLMEWDSEMNAPLLPNDIAVGSNKNVWWKCWRGHSYTSQPNNRKSGNGCPYCSGRKVLAGFNDLATLNPKLAQEWDYEKNSPLTPNDVTIGSNTKVWWKCSKNHSWDAIIANRSKGAGCPFCSNTKVLAGYNDLLTINPKLAAEWNYENNVGLKDQRGRDISTPDKVTDRSGLDVWWRCSKGHSWQATVCERSHNELGCPICSNKCVLQGYNDLATTNPALAKEWNYEKNKGLKNKQGKDISTPDKVTAGAHQKVWWKCPLGHEYPAVIEGRSRGNGCPFCSKNNKNRDPEFYKITDQLLSEWDYKNNKNLNPNDLPEDFREAVWWKCIKGHIYKATISSKNHGKQCPYCLDEGKDVNIENLSSDLYSEWDFDKNGSLDPHKLKAITLLKAWWKCKYGHSWQALVSNRVRGAGCPYCKNSGSSMPEQGIAYYLSDVCRIEQRIKINKREIDIYLPDFKIGVEYDGLYYHNNDRKKKQDEEKDLVAIRSGLFLLRIKESDENALIGEDIIKYKTDNMGSNYEWALHQLCHILSILTENNEFESIDIDIGRDRLRIRERFNLSIKENSLASKYPEIASEWNYDKNGILLPDMFSYGAQDKVWWMCSLGHEYQATIGSRTNMKSGCPYCAGKALLSGFNDLATLNPGLAKEWDYEKNKGLKNGDGIDVSTPDKVTAHTKQKVWWKCNKGHSWNTDVSGRSRGNGCPICSHQKVLKGFNDLATSNPELAKEWNFDKNDPYTPSDFTSMSGQRVWWKCSSGHEWQANINNRCRGNRCPVCSNVSVLQGFNDLATIKPELAKEWNYPKNNGLKDKRGRDVSTPEKVVVSSQLKAWWICSKGHEWQATVANRSFSGTGCLQCYRLSRTKKVMNIDTQEIFNSTKEASISSGAEMTGICNCCNGKQKTAGGYHWKYVD
jgi:hypothetical protein